MSRLTGTPYVYDGLERTKYTESQVGQSARARKAQLKDAFRAENKSFADKRILLVDDVCTTGSTVNACAKALKHAGVAHIHVLTFAFVEPVAG